MVQWYRHYVYNYLYKKRVRSCTYHYTLSFVSNCLTQGHHNSKYGFSSYTERVVNLTNIKRCILTYPKLKIDNQLCVTIKWHVQMT